MEKPTRAPKPKPEEMESGQPVTANRAVLRSGVTRVRANCDLVEFVFGERTCIAKGEEGEIETARVVPLDDAVTPL